MEFSEKELGLLKECIDFVVNRATERMDDLKARRHFFEWMNLKDEYTLQQIKELTELIDGWSSKTEDIKKLQQKWLSK